jgi:putative membrane protein
MMGTGMAVMLICAALGIALVAGVVWLVLRAGSEHAPEPGLEGDGGHPLQLLRERYAAGEIDEDEYLRRLSGLSQR